MKGVLHTARISTAEVIVAECDRCKKMVNFELSNEIPKVFEFGRTLVDIIINSFR